MGTTRRGGTGEWFPLIPTLVGSTVFSLLGFSLLLPKQSYISTIPIAIVISYNIEWKS